MSELTDSNRRRAFIVPRLVRGDADVKEKRLKSRQDELESHIKSQHFYDWLTSQKEKNPGSLQVTDPLW
jgi:E3 ubiquitin-protein ligase RHA2